MKTRYYHLSQNGAIEKLVPRVPVKLWPGHEDNYVERICFSDTINGCLQALYAGEGDIYNIYVPLSTIILYRPTVLEVMDADMTGEKWGVDETTVIKIAKIKVLHCKNIGTVLRQEVTIPKTDYTWCYINK